MAQHQPTDTIMLLNLSVDFPNPLKMLQPGRKCGMLEMERKMTLLSVNLSCFMLAGRLFDFHVLDMIELGIEKYVSLSDIKVMVALPQLTSVLSLKGDWICRLVEKLILGVS